MKVLGFVPSNFNLKERWSSLLRGNAAFYDPKTKTMHLIKEPEEKLKKAPDTFERLMGKRRGAFQGREQNHDRPRDDSRPRRPAFDIDKMQKAIKQNDDSTSLSGLIEGEPP